MTYLYILIFTALLITAYQDIKSRLIHVGLPILIFILAMVTNKEFLVWNEMLTSLLFLTINFVVITIYFSIKNSALINPFKSYIGLGDLLFLLAVVPFFSFRNYLLFFVTGMIFSLILYSLFKKKYLVKTIPLAGYLSIYLIGLITFNLFIQHNLFHDSIL